MRYVTLCFIACVLVGCMSYPPERMVNAFINPQQPLRVSPENPLCFQENPDNANPLFEKEVIQKATTLWQKAGYTIVACEQADYIITLEYGFGESQLQEKLALFPAYHLQVYPWVGLIFSGFTFLPREREMTVHWLIARLQDPRLPEKDPRRLLWMAEVTYLAPKGDLRLAMDDLLQGALTTFGKDTSHAIPY